MHPVRPLILLPLIGFASLGAWLAPWTARGFTHGDGPLQAVVAIVVVGLLLRERPHAPRSATGLVAPALAIGAPLVGALALHSVHLDLVVALATIGALLGWTGLLWGRLALRRAMPIAGLAMLLLPVTDHLDVVLGWPLRKLAAGGAAFLLGGVGVEPIAVETVLRLEGAIAHVDLPCAGMRSLWSLGVIGLLAVVASRRSLSVRLALAMGAASAVLLVANVLRVTAIVGLQHVLGFPLLADIVHQPLGVLGFVVALAVGALVAGFADEPEPAPVAATPASPLIRGVATACLAVLLAATLSSPAPVAPSPVVALPVSMSPLVPTDQELQFAATHGATVTKGAFHGGSVVMVTSRSWAAHHVPRMCLEAAGFTLSEDRPAWVDGAPLRVAAARHGSVSATALWWLQAVDTVTDDHVVRIRNGFVSDQPWVLVSVLLDGDADPGDPSVVALVDDLRAQVARALEEA